MNNLVEALLAADAGKITAKATEDFEVKRLSKLIGEPFILHLRKISPRRMTELQENAVKYDSRGKVVGRDTYGMGLALLCDGITNKDFDNREVLKHYGVATRKELFELLFNVAEMGEISTHISELCGIGVEEEQVDELKN